MEAEEEQDRFASIIELCKPTASQEAKFTHCPLARESEISDPDQSSSPDPTPSEPIGIVMVSLPCSSSPVHQQVEDEAVFHTPPEHHVISSSEDENLDVLCAQGVRDDEPEAKKIRIDGEELDGETVPVGETEVIEVEANEGNTEVIVLDSTDSGDEMDTVNLGEDSVNIPSGGGIEVGTADLVQKNGELRKDVAPKVDADKGNHELGRKCKSVERQGVSKVEKPTENSDLCGSLDSGKIEEDIVKTKYIVGNGCVETREKSGVGRSEKVVEITEDAKMPEDGHRDDGPETDGKRKDEIGLKTDGKRIEEIDEFRYVGDIDVRWKGRTGRAAGGAGRRRQLPVSLKGKGKEKEVGGADVAETVQTKRGLLNFLNVLKGVVGDTDGGCEDVDFLETAKRRGLIFPRVRWWPSEGDNM